MHFFSLLKNKEITMAKKDQLEELSSDELKSILDEESENIDPSSKTDDKDKAE